MFSATAGLGGKLQRDWYRGALWLVLLRPLEWLYRMITGVRRYCYSRGWLSVYRATVPVVVVGNITVGGTGKTPTVIALVQALAARGVRAGVVSRGVGARRATFPYRVHAASTAQDCGDEAVMIFQRSGAPCVVAPRRRAALALLEASGEVDVVLSDDGLQHYGMARDFEVALYDQQAGFGNGRCLPAGPLREPLSRLRTVDVVLARGAGAGPHTLALEPDALVNLASGEVRPLDAHGLPADVLAVAGIGLPELFFTSLEALGFRVTRRTFPDHHAYLRSDLHTELERPVIMTEKDAVKCRDIATSNMWYLRVDAIVPEAVIDQVAALVASTASAKHNTEARQ